MYLLLQGVSEPGAAATLGAAAAPGRADRTKHCRDQLEFEITLVLIEPQLLETKISPAT